MTLQQLRDQAAKRGDTTEAQRLDRLVQRMDEQRQAYGRAQRGEPQP